MSRCY